MALYSWFFETSKVTDYALTSITVVIVAFLGGLYAMQSRLIYIPHFPPGSRKEIWRPNRFGFQKFDEVNLITSDKVQIHAFWIPCQTQKSTNVPTIIFFHVKAKEPSNSCRPMLEM
jgi:hypothetical protein